MTYIAYLADISEWVDIKIVVREYEDWAEGYVDTEET